VSGDHILGVAQQVGARHIGPSYLVFTSFQHFIMRRVLKAGFYFDGADGRCVSSL
jgi:hypothetical protein